MYVYAEYLYLIHCAITLYLTGLIWFVQVVHYPLMSRVGASDYVKYQALHVRRTTLVVALPMLVEAFSSLALIAFRPEWLSLFAAALLAGMVLLIWISTALLQVPQHRQLEKDFSASAHRLLVRSNWLRTLLWSARSVILIAHLALYGLPA